ncbi:MAG: NuoI/complex I 23 kDa subunit family protein [Bacteroidota bacterium]
MKQYLKNTWDGLWTVLIGMKITFKHLFVPSVTIQYPDVKMDLPDRARNRLYVNIDDCIGCDQCARACPVDCITIDTVKGVPGDEVGKTSQGKKKALWVTSFEIDFAKCCCCGLCTFPCPTECIKMTDVHEFSEYYREDLVYNFSALTSAEAEDKKKKYAAAEAEKAAQKAAAAAAAASETAQQAK